MSYARDFDRRVRLGVVGVGLHSYRTLLPVLTYLPAQLVAISDPDSEKAYRTARQYGLQRHYDHATDMYEKEELDAVLLCVGPKAHPRLAIEALNAGLNVWCEKPVGMSVADVDAMLTARGDRVAVVGYKKVFMSAAVKARELLSLPEFGRLHSLSGVYPMSIPRGGPEVLLDREVTNWLANGCHPTSLLLSLAGPAAGVAVHRAENDSGVLVINHHSGAVTALHLASGAPSVQPIERYLLVGDGRTIEIRNSRRIVYQRGIEHDYAATKTFAPEGTDSGAVVWEAQDTLSTFDTMAAFTQGVYGELRYFFDRVLDGQTARLGSLEFAREVMQVYEAALQSRGEMVEIRRAGE